MIKTIEWTDEGIRMLDQRLLPTEEKYLIAGGLMKRSPRPLRKWSCAEPSHWRFGSDGACALAQASPSAPQWRTWKMTFDYMCRVMSETRPTAVNLFWAIERMRETFRREKTSGQDPEKIKARLVEEARSIFREDIEANRALDASEPNCFQTVTQCSPTAMRVLWPLRGLRNRPWRYPRRK